jgi:ribosome biogenesis protein SSF1/2
MEQKHHDTPTSVEKMPKSFVVKTGKVGKSVKELIADFRDVMEPNTASRLQTKSKNTLRDFLSVAGTLGVTHFVLFSQVRAAL